MERNPSPPALTEAEEEVLSTDCIGDTVFSKRWVLRVLLDLMTWKEKLQESITEGSDRGEDLFTVKELDTELEEELCELWDMTTNQDVCEFMDEQDGVDLLFETTLFSNYPRLTEICIGVLGNMVCLPHIAKEITHTEKYRTILLSEINNDDPQTLIELTRLIRTCMAVDEQRTAWFQSMKELKTLNQLAFILESSLNVDLIYNVADLVDFVFDLNDDMMGCISSERLLSCLCEGLQQTKSSKPQCVDVIVHIIQLITTSKEGLKAFGESDISQNMLCKVLSKTELNLVTALNRLPMLASAFSVLGSLYPNYKDKFWSLISSETSLVTKMVLSLEVLQRVYSSSSTERKDANLSNGEKTDNVTTSADEDQEQQEAYNEYTSSALALFHSIVEAMESDAAKDSSEDLLRTFSSLKSQIQIVLKFWSSKELFNNEVSKLEERIKACEELDKILCLRPKS